MNNSFLCVLPLLLAAARVHALPFTTSWNSGFANAGVVPDGNVTGWSDTRVISGFAANSILDVNVTLQLGGGWNGDLYAYLTHSSGFSVLLNRSGVTGGNPFGYGDAGLNVTLDDAAANGDIHGYQTVLGFAGLISTGGAWSPDGRNVNPLGALNTDARTALLNSFNGLDPNGSWTLFLADVSNGDSSTVLNWGLAIEAEQRALGVPDAGATLPLLGMAFVGLAWFARRRANSGGASTEGATGKCGLDERRLLPLLPRREERVGERRAFTAFLMSLEQIVFGWRPRQELTGNEINFLNAASPASAGPKWLRAGRPQPSPPSDAGEGESRAVSGCTQSGYATQLSIAFPM